MIAQHISYKNKLVIVTGPTAVGKTSIVETIAEWLPCEIVNADMGQCYEPLTIGTAKPNWRMQKVPHHLFDIFKEPYNYTVVEYRQAIIKQLEKIWQQNKLPIIVGGSFFYIFSLFFPPSLIHQNIELIPLHGTLQELWSQLYAIDQQRALQIDPHDRYRIERALRIWLSTGNKPSAYAPEYNPIAKKTLLLHLSRDRQELYSRIDERVKDMIKSGLLDEVQALLGTEWEPFLLEKKIIGYDDCIHYLYSIKQNKKNIDFLLQQIAQKTRHYAKRQTTYWRMFRDKISAVNKSDTVVSVRELSLTGLHQDIYIKQLLDEFVEGEKEV